MERELGQETFIGVLETEQFVLQGARTAIVAEMTGRASVYMSSVASSLIAFGFVAQVVHNVQPFVAPVLTALIVLGEFTFVAMSRITMENVVLLRQMNRIRDQYRRLVPGAEEFFSLGSQDVAGAAMRTIGLPSASFSMLFTGASVIASVNAILEGVAVALLVGRWAQLTAFPLALIGVGVALLMFGLHLVYQNRERQRLNLSSL